MLHQYINTKNNQADMVIVGGGPVGLWTAIQLKRLQKSAKVVVLEKHAEYQRVQELRLSLDILNSNPDVKNAINKLIQCHEVTLDRDRQSIFISIKRLESILKEIAQKSNVEIQNKEVTSLDQVRNEYPKAKTIIGSDGARSVIRRTVFGEDEKVVDKTVLQNMIELRYAVKGKAKKLSAFYHFHAQVLLAFGMDNSANGSLCAESIKYDEKTDTSVVTLRFIVSDAVFNDRKLEKAVAKSPMPLSTNIPHGLFNAINIWVNLRGDKGIIKNSATLNKTIISKAICRQSAIHIRDAGNKQCHVYLVGDSLMGLPYMNGLNIGMECANHLASLLAKNGNYKKDNQAPLIAEYQTISQALYESVSYKISKKDFQINYSKLVLKIYYVLTGPFRYAELLLRDNINPIFGAEKSTSGRWIAFAIGAVLLNVASIPLLGTLQGLSFGLVAALDATTLLAGGLLGYRYWKFKQMYDTQHPATPEVKANKTLYTLLKPTIGGQVLSQRKNNDQQHQFSFKPAFRSPLSKEIDVQANRPSFSIRL